MTNTLQDEIALQNTVQQDLTNISRYFIDYRLFCTYCENEHKPINEQSFMHYLHYSLKQQKVKKSTFNRRYFAIKKLFESNGIPLTDAHKSIVLGLRKQYSSEEHAAQSAMVGKKAIDSNELLPKIRLMDDIRAKAILFVQFYTANRPSEMVLLKIGDFNLPQREVVVYLQKQRKFKSKTLAAECIDALKAYISMYQLADDDYLIGHVHQNGQYNSRSISLPAYYKMLDKWVGYSAYNFRKSLVSHMHKNGAPVEVIQRQTGHTSSQTIIQHYLNVDKASVDKFL